MRARLLQKTLLSLTLAVALSACLEVQDDPTKVVDLRVLGVQVEPPELMATGCDFEDTSVLLPFAQPVTLTALLVDPAGGGRSLEYELLACAAQDDLRCEDSRVSLAQGTATAGELSLTITPAFAVLEDGRPLLLATIEEDDYFGFGGARVSLVLRVRAGEEEIYAQKLMVYACPLVPGMTANVNPFVPALTFADVAWDEAVVPSVSGPGPHPIEVADPAGAQEAYVVPSLEQTPRPIPLTEAWTLSWHTDYGRFDPRQTGGAEFAGDGTARLRGRWFPPTDAEPREVRVWVVARDGRGGLAWVERRFSYTP